ncbi:LuxR C-terminal-related transcriptional regulator [Streptomyces sp. R21]|uniref:LuxR C-terminal-related transcriptional regulator n=1 Tax=Streptomyces sp. R21 TaxID=3238627 RepID=A0AB39P1H4_9ACTN
MLTPSGAPLLSTRFAIPTVPPTFVRRSRLTERLADGVNRPLVLVNGSAGAGKTLLVADWLRQRRVSWPTAWLTVEPDDNAPGMFWAYVLAALRHHGLDLPPDIGSPARADEVDQLLLARLAAHLSGRTDPVLLVLDEFERVPSPEIAGQLEFVLRHAAAGLRLVLVSRVEPLLPLHRWRAAGEIADIRGGDLAFTAQEAAVLLARHGLSRPDEAARTLTERTEGWAAGLRLCALAMQEADDPDRFLKEFEAGHSTVADYLLGEVLARQPAQTQELLLRTSVLERTHPDLANALTGREDSEGILISLERANAFVTAVGHSWYRHHPLFSEILRAHLRFRHPGLEGELHRRAARWFCDAGQFTDALPHAVAAGDWEFAAAQFVDQLAIGQLFTGLDANRLGEVFSAMAPDADGPAPELVRAARDLARYDVTSGLAHLERAEEYLAHGAQGSAAARLSHAFLRVLAGRLLGSAAMAQTAARDAEQLERQVPAERLADHPELPALLLTGLGSAELWAGQLDAAREALCAAVEASGHPGTASSGHEALGRIALIDFLRGWPGKAEASAREAVAVAERAGLPLPLCSGVAHLVLAATAIDRDERASARADLDRAAASSGAHDDPVVAAGITILNSRMLLAEGDPEGSLYALTGAEDRSAAGVRSPWVRSRLALARSHAHLAQGHPEAALDALDEAVTETPDCAVIAARARIASGDNGTAIDILDSVPTDPGTGPAITVRTLLARAEAADCQGDTVAARCLVVRALGLARPEQLRRPFLEAGPWLRRALHDPLVPAHDWLPAEPFATPSARPAGTVQVLVVEALSAREHDVLECLAQVMSTDEMAAELYLSVNTVKTHLKSIYRKLSASRRGEAVRRARELGLL